jgi:hypothetical protein
MALTLAQLLPTQSVDTWRALLIGALQGLGIVIPGGTAAGSSQSGTGSLTLSGAPSGTAYPKVVVKIVTAGELGTGAFQYSLDGGTTFSGSVGIPASPGTYALGSTGVSITFVAGPIGGGTSFQLGDTFTFAISIPGLNTTFWGSGGAYRTLLELLAQALADFSTSQISIAASGFLQAWLNPSSLGLTASPPSAWLDLIGTYFYNLTRSAAAATIGLATLTAAASAGPYTIAAGTMWFADAAGHRFSNANGGTLIAGGTLQLSWQAESPGAAYNLANSTPITIVAGALAGVTVANPNPGSGTWVTTQGSDAESDLAYATRCQARWPSLAAPGTSPAGQFTLWCLSAEAAAGHSTTITKTLVQADAALPGQVDIYLAGTSGAVGGAAVTDVTTYLAQRTGLTNSVVVAAASNAVMTVAGTVNYYAAKTTLAAVQAAVAANLAAYINSLAIGPDGAGTVKVYYSEIIAAVGSAFGVRNYATPTLNAGTADVALTLGQVATLTNSITFTAV